MATVVMMIGVLTILAIVLIDQVTAESNRAGRAVREDAVYQAAEAGINDYIAKLVEDPQFYDHWVANGESTRRPPSGADVGPGSEWISGTSWTYPTSVDAPEGKSTWYSGGSATTSIGDYAYNLMVAPPSSESGNTYVTVVSTGCKVVDPAATPLVCSDSVRKRAIEIHLETVTPADFSFMYGETPTQWGSTADTYGRIYSLGDICHDGTAHGDLMAEGYVNKTRCYDTGSTYRDPINFSWADGAQKYDSTTTPKASCPAGSDPACPLKGAVQFSNFATSLTDIKRAASLNSPTTAFDVSGKTWKILFEAGSGTAGTVKVWQCSGSSTPAATAPSCNSTPTYNGALPKNGAIFTGQSAIVYGSGTNSVVNGRVTVASNGEIVVGSNIHYQSEYGGTNDDVLGLIAYQNVWVAAFAPNQLTWRAAVIAETGMESVWDCTHGGTYRGSSSNMTFIGSIASKDGSGCAARGTGATGGGYASRVYASDDGTYTPHPEYNALKFLFPPWYPIIDTQVTSLFREVPATYAPPAS